MRQALAAMCAELDLSWTDLYPSDHGFTLMKTRGTLFHSARPIEHEFLWKETERLRALVERILLAMLGWRHSLSPAAHTLTWLSNVDAGRMGTRPDVTQEVRLESGTPLDDASTGPRGDQEQE